MNCNDETNGAYLFLFRLSDLDNAVIIIVYAALVFVHKDKKHMNFYFQKRAVYVNKNIHAMLMR